MQSAQGLLEFQSINRFRGLWKKSAVQKKDENQFICLDLGGNKCKLFFFVFFFLILIGFDDGFLVRLDFVWRKTIFAFKKQKMFMVNASTEKRISKLLLDTVDFFMDLLQWWSQIG